MGSLSGGVNTNDHVPQKHGWRNFLPYVGPGFLVLLAYLDLGNLGTGLLGASHGYELLWIILMGLIFALAANLGVSACKHLSEMCMAECPFLLRCCLWLLAELAIIAADIGINASGDQEQAIQLQSELISTKLNDSNYLVWRQQVLTAIRGYGLLGYIDGSEIAPRQYLAGTYHETPRPNPAYSLWNRQDQLLASWLLSSLSEDLLISTVGLNTSKEIWENLETTFASQNSAKIAQCRLQLQTIKKGNMSMREYFNKVKSCCDVLASAGETINEQHQISCILFGLGPEYNDVLVSVTSRVVPCTLTELYSILLSFEHSYGNSNFAGGRGQRSRFNNRGRGRAGNYRGRGGFNRPRCQICHYNNHTADKCYYRCDLNSLYPSVNVANRGNSETTDDDVCWYPDSGETTHITYDMSNLNIDSGVI